MPGNNFFDLEEVVRDWGWRKYDQTATRKQRKLREKQERKNEPYIGVNIDWSDVEFKDTTLWTKLADDDFSYNADRPLAGATDTGKNEAEQNHNKVKANTMQHANVSCSNVNVLFQTEFTNSTRAEQQYTLRIDKTTRSTCSTSIEKGVCRGFELGVSLKIPGDVLEANAGFKREVSLTSTSGEEIEEELSWGAESSIKVAPRHAASAQLVVKEKKQSGDFVVETTARGTVQVNFTNMRDNNCLLKPVSGDIAYVVQKHIEQKQKIGQTFNFVQVNDSVVLIKTNGSCRFRYGVKQEVMVDQTPLP